MLKKRKTENVFKKIWIILGNPISDFGIFSALGIFSTLAIVVGFVKDYFGIKILFEAIFFPIYLISFFTYYFYLDKKLRSTILVKSFFYTSIFLVITYFIGVFVVLA
ncbi:MAG TPA: hypothetical protein VJZ93_03830 [Candidatus Nanoarchaeia archaeon]|nr:hypothetical protein [Candidatus Nanoarchaeia archaeon]